MRIQGSFAVAAAALVLAASGPAEAQRSTFDLRSPSTHPGANRPASSALPSSPILPMGSPILPMTNPIAPIVPNIFLGTSPAQPARPARPNTIRPGSSGDKHPDNRGDNRGRGDRDRNRDVTIVVPGLVIIPGGDVIVPGAKPRVDPRDHAAPSSSFSHVGPQTPVHVEPRAPQPPLLLVPARPRQIPVITPSPVGTTRADAIARHGQPFGMIKVGGSETLYFEGGTILVIEDGRVARIK